MRLSFVKTLLEQGADVHLMDADGNTALRLAQGTYNQEIVNMLHSRRLFSRLDSSNSTHRSPRNLDGSSMPTCVICMDRPAQVILAPCGHKVLCKEDCRRLFELPEEQRVCPMHKEKIESFVIRVFDP